MDQMGRISLVAVLAAAFALLVGCSIEEKKGQDGTKKVSIDTPFASLKVNTDVDPASTGLPVYPGARRKTKDEPGEESGANVTISSEHFGLKVAAVEFESDDEADKVLAFYRDRMKKFGGKFLECKKQGWNRHETHGDGDKELECDGDGHGDSVELKAGTPDDHHIVAVRRDGKGTAFALVHIQKRGKAETL